MLENPFFVDKVWVFIWWHTGDLGAFTEAPTPNSLLIFLSIPLNNHNISIKVTVLHLARALRHTAMYEGANQWNTEKWYIDIVENHYCGQLW